jgi:hypothetical protein
VLGRSIVRPRRIVCPVGIKTGFQPAQSSQKNSLTHGFRACRSCVKELSLVLFGCTSAEQLPAAAHTDLQHCCTQPKTTSPLRCALTDVDLRDAGPARRPSAER